jgi:hypothetical protein
MRAFYRCQGECGRKWHEASLAYERKPVVKPVTDLLDLAPPPSDGCPSCGGALKPERGTFESRAA